MKSRRPHPRDLDIVISSAKAWFEQDDLFRRFVTPRNPEDFLWADEDRERPLKIEVPEAEFVEAFAKSYVAGNMHWEMEDKLRDLTGFTHAYVDDPEDPEMHVGSAFHGFMEFHRARYDEIVRGWVKDARLERPFPVWAKVRVWIEERWLEHDDVSAGRPVDDALIEFEGIASASPTLDELGLFKFIPEHLMREQGRQWPPTAVHEIPRYRLFPVEAIASILPREEQDHADMDAYIALKKLAVDQDRQHLASFKARKRLEQFRRASEADIGHYKALLKENLHLECPRSLAGLSKAAEQLALEALVARTLRKHLRFTGDPDHYF